jgi:hypothetical protein
MTEQRLTSRSPVSTSRIVIHLVVAAALFAAAVLLTGCGA